MDEVERHTLIVVDDVAQVVAPAVVGFAHAHRVVREVDIAVVALRVRLIAIAQSRRRCVAYKRLY